MSGEASGCVLIFCMFLPFYCKYFFAQFYYNRYITKGKKTRENEGGNGNEKENMESGFMCGNGGVNDGRVRSKAVDGGHNGSHDGGSGSGYGSGSDHSSGG